MCLEKGKYFAKETPNNTYTYKVTDHRNNKTISQKLEYTHFVMSYLSDWSSGSEPDTLKQQLKNNQD